MQALRSLACALLAVLVAPSFADVLTLSETKVGIASPDSEEIWCYYTKDGTASATVFGTVSFPITPQKSLLGRILGRQLSEVDRQSACPKSVNRYPVEPPKQETFNTCVLQHMQGVTSDLATVAVKESCIRTTEIPIPADAVRSLETAVALFWKSPFLGGGSGLYVTVNNNSGYTLTELVIAVADKKTKAVERYTVRSFHEATPGMVITGLPKDPSVWLMIRPGVETFFTQIRQVTSDQAKWPEAYEWGIMSAKGFRD